MKTFSILFGMALGSLLFTQTGFSADTSAGKWEILFNGKDLTGWEKVHDVDFQVVEGNLRLVKGMGWLRTKKQYQDFNLEMEWRALVPEYDSGIFLRAGEEGKPWPNGGWQVNLKYHGLGALVKGYKTMVPSETSRKPVNQWVKLRVEVRGKQCKLIVDGEDGWETDIIDADKGFIGIQAENRAFDFRHIRIQEIPAIGK